MGAADFKMKSNFDKGSHLRCTSPCLIFSLPPFLALFTLLLQVLGTPKEIKISHSQLATKDFDSLLLLNSNNNSKTHLTCIFRHDEEICDKLR